MKNKVKNGTFLVFTMCFVILLVPEIVNAYCGTCGNTPQSTVDDCGFTVTHNCTYNSPLCRYEDCGPWPVSGGIYRPSEGRTCYYNFVSTACGGGTGGEEECTGCSCTLPTCPVANDNDTRYTEDLPKDGDVVIEDPLPACVGKPNTCINKDSCGNACGNNPSENCYLPETNLTAISDIPTPSWNNLKIGIRTFENLSTDSTKPSVVALPLPGVTISSITNVVANPTGSRELRYKFFIDATEPAVVQTYIKDDMENPEKLVDKPLIAKMVEGYEGSIATNYQTVNVCNDTVKEGGVLTTYYKVNGLPGHDGSISLEIGPLNANDDKDQGCKITDKYSGKKLHNPLKVVIKGTDENGTDTINGAYFWMVKKDIYSTFPPSYFDKRYPVGPGESRTNPNIIGLFVSRKVVDGNVYINLYKSTGNLSGFNRDSGGVYKEDNRRVQDLDNKELFTVIDIPTYNITSDGKFTFELHLEFPENSPLTGNYQLYAGMTDTLSYYPIGGETWVELRTNQLKTNPSWQWNFDFLDPTITAPTAISDPGDQRKIQLNWGSNGTGSDIQNTVVNVYKTMDPIYPIRKLLPTPEVDINIIHPEDVPTDSIGLISASITSGWQFKDLTSTKFNINNNSNGVLSEYVTIYDQGCNFTSTGGANNFPPTNLDRWIATKGGVFYSDDRIGYIPKEKAGEKFNLGTELITTRISQNPHPDTKDWGELMNPVTVITVMDTNDLENGDKFDFLVTKFERMKDKVAFGSVTANNLNCTNTAGCILYLTTPITLGKTDDTTQIYSGKILVYTTENITVGPNLVAQNPAVDGLILLAAKNITVHSTKHSSTVGNVHYDLIDALMISKDQINIPDGLAADLGIQQDGVLINGSLLAFGATQNPSIYLKRNLGLLNISYPVLIVNYHPKYAKLSELFFGTDTTTYKQEVGFKF